MFCLSLELDGVRCTAAAPRSERVPFGQLVLHPRLETPTARKALNKVSIDKMVKPEIP